MTSHPSMRSSKTMDEEQSFPNPVGLAIPGGRGQQALSVVSSAMTDIPDEEGEEGTQNRVQGITGPVGDSGLPPSRPSTAATGKTATTSKRGQGSTSNSRPPSSYSRTHVPSLTSSAFFRPMSSQRLQAQRGQRPASNLGPRSIPSSDGPQDRRPIDSRQSASTTRTQQGAAAAQVGLSYDERPLSRGSDVTEIPDRGTANTSPHGADTLRSGADTFRSAGESETPLSGESPPRHRPDNLDLTRPFKSTASQQAAQKSPRSFRSSFILSSRNSRNSISMRQQGHEKLDSVPSSPDEPPSIARDQVKQELGKNYEYFTGNTAFLWGGRLQNAREKPINVGTGLAILVPACLFFGFS